MIEPTMQERAQGWSLDRRMGKAQEECAELIAALNRYKEALLTDDPVKIAYEKLKVGEEIVGVHITLGNIERDFADACQATLNMQLQRFEAKLQKDGL